MNHAIVMHLQEGGVMDIYSAFKEWVDGLLLERDKQREAYAILWQGMERILNIAIREKDSAEGLTEVSFLAAKYIEKADEKMNAWRRLGEVSA